MLFALVLLRFHSSFHSTVFSIFNPADYTANSRARQDTWAGNESAEGTGKENNRFNILSNFLCLL